MAADGRGWPWKLPRQLPRNYRGNRRGLPWVAMVGTTEFTTGITVARAGATTAAHVVEAP